MTKTIILLVLLASGSVTAYSQRTFDVKNASKFFDIKIKVADCDEMFCRGKASYSFFKKGEATPYQVIEVEDTLIDVEGGKPAINETLLYDKQSAVNVGDFNFDGMEDVAICTGDLGPYNSPSYDVYLSSRAKRKFVYNEELSTALVGLGMFEVDPVAKRLITFNKDGCCWHTTEEYSVIRNRPVKVRQVIEDATGPKRVKVTTKTLVRGKWKSVTRYEEYKDQ